MTLSEDDRAALCEALHMIGSHESKKVVDASTWLTQAAAMAARGPSADPQLAAIILQAARVVYVVGRAGQDG